MVYRCNTGCFISSYHLRYSTRYEAFRMGARVQTPRTAEVEQARGEHALPPHTTTPPLIPLAEGNDGHAAKVKEVQLALTQGFETAERGETRGGKGRSGGRAAHCGTNRRGNCVVTHRGCGGGDGGSGSPCVVM